MNWHDLQILLAFRRQGTLQKSAAALAVDISTVSRRLRALEAELDAPLVENIQGRLTLTAQGEAAARAAEAMEAESDALHRDLKGRDASLSGTLRVALLDVFATAHMDLLEAFKAAYPQVVLELLCSTSRTHSLTRREAEVAIRVSRRPDETLVGRKVLELDYAVYASRDLVARGGRDWRALPWLAFDLAAQAAVTEDWMKRQGVLDQVRLRTDSPAALFRAAEAGAGAAALAMPYAARCPGLVRLSDPLSGFGTEVWLLTHRDLRRNARVRAFLDHMYEGLTAWRRAAPGLEAAEPG